MGEKCKTPRDALIFAIIVLAALFGFGLGYLAGLERGGGTYSPGAALNPL